MINLAGISPNRQCFLLGSYSGTSAVAETSAVGHFPDTSLSPHRLKHPALSTSLYRPSSTSLGSNAAHQTITFKEHSFTSCGPQPILSYTLVLSAPEEIPSTLCCPLLSVLLGSDAPNQGYLSARILFWFCFRLTKPPLGFTPYECPPYPIFLVY